MIHWVREFIARRSSKRRVWIIEQIIRDEDSLRVAASLKRMELMGWIEPAEYDDQGRVIRVQLCRSYWTSMSDKARILQRKTFA